jgi:protoporphyrinogen oxidase
MNTPKKHWGIVGGGILGMQIANKLVKQGDEVTLLEAAPQLGGLTSAWQVGPAVWDKYYHVILLSDTVLGSLLEELKLKDEMNWVETKTGFYTDGKLYSMSNSIEFLKFPPLSLIDKFRLGLTIFYASKVKNWKRLEKIYVADWLRKWSGKNTFEKIWLPLLRAKLGENYQHTSASFIWSTIQRMYAARKTGLKKEMFGYVEGGYARILDTFTKHLEQQGVQIKTGFRAGRIQAEEEGGVVVHDQEGHALPFDEVILTVPSMVASNLCDGLREEEKEKLQNIEYLGVICASVLLKKSISPYYVTNVTDQTPFTGIIEMTTMVDPEHFGGHSLIYLPKYVKKTDPIFKMSDEEIKELFWNTLKNMYDHISEEDLVSFKVARAPHVFALSTIAYSENLPDISTSLPGVHILNSAHIVNGTLNVNETLQLVEKKLPAIIESARKRPQNIQSYE